MCFPNAIVDIFPGVTICRPMREIFYGDIYAAARALVGLSQVELAGRAKLERRTIIKIEKMRPDQLRGVELEHLQIVRRVLEEAGARFVSSANGMGEGVCRAEPYEVGASSSK